MAGSFGNKAVIAVAAGIQGERTDERANALPALFQIVNDLITFIGGKGAVADAFFQIVHILHPFALRHNGLTFLENTATVRQIFKRHLRFTPSETDRLGSMVFISC